MTQRQRAVLAVPVLASLMFGASCASDMVREGRGGSYLVIDALEGANGADKSGKFGATMQSDVVTMVKSGTTTSPSIFEDPGRVTMHIQLKDIGTPANPTQPSGNNVITVNRYRVVYRRSDGRNTPGVDVPYPFDGGATFTVGEDSVQASFTIVRTQSKMEPPLIALGQGGPALAISTLADVTFYGHDQAGNEVSVTGTMSINFANWGDPE